MTHPLITILGPTASGKSALALDLAAKYSGEIICADSRTIYRGMDIGTAKPFKADQARIPHHLLDVCEPDERFSVQAFVTQAEETLVGIWKRGKVAFLVGGSGLYIDALLFGYVFRAGANEEEDLSDLSDAELLERARTLYPQALLEIETQNRRRVEQLVSRGPASAQDREKLKHDGIIIGLDPGQSNLKNNIVKRTTQMLEAGFVIEVEELLRQFSSLSPGLHTTGYKTIVEMLEGNIDREDVAPEIVRDTLRLAKKQRTWFKRNPHIQWFENPTAATRAAANYLTG